MKTKLKEFKVRIEYHSVIRDTVWAKDEEDAIRVVEQQTSGNEIAIQAETYDATAEEL